MTSSAAQIYKTQHRSLEGRGGAVNGEGRQTFSTQEFGQYSAWLLLSASDAAFGMLFGAMRTSGLDVVVRDGTSSASVAASLPQPSQE